MITITTLATTMIGVKQGKLPATSTLQAYQYASSFPSLTSRLILTTVFLDIISSVSTRTTAGAAIIQSYQYASSFPSLTSRVLILTTVFLDIISSVSTRTTAGAAIIQSYQYTSSFPSLITRVLMLDNNIGNLDSSGKRRPAIPFLAFWE